MLSQRRNCRLIAGIVSLVLIIGTGALVTSPAYAEGAESEGIPGHRVGGGTRVSTF